MTLKVQKTRDHSAWTIGNGDPTYEVCIPHSILRAYPTQYTTRMETERVKEEEGADTRIIV